jgi:hypothetical protein
MDELAKLPATLFSPAKMFYIAYVVILVWKTSTPSHGEFFLVSALFLAVEILHNDWCRILLNNHAKKTTPQWERK